MGGSCRDRPPAAPDSSAAPIAPAAFDEATADVVTIGYYVHHHGAGHAARFAKIAAASDTDVVPISELQLHGGVRLPGDVVDDGRDPTAGGALHWAPIGAARSAERALVFGRWLEAARPCGVVVDVSVEAALLCRLFGVATVVVRQHGDRTDAAHELAYRSAVRLLAPFPRDLEHPSTPSWVIAKTDYAGFITDDGDPDRAPIDPDTPIPDPCDVVILWGAGGGELSERDIEDIVAAGRPGSVWFAGAATSVAQAAGARALGWVKDVPGLLQRRPTVVASAGNNVVADAADAGCALVVVPQARPFDEQRRHAESLHAAGAAAVVGDIGGVGDGSDRRARSDEDGRNDEVGRGDGARDWGRALTTARARRRRLHDLASTGGARAAADAIGQAFGPS